MNHKVTDRDVMNDDDISAAGYRSLDRNKYFGAPVGAMSLALHRSILQFKSDGRLPTLAVNMAEFSELNTQRKDHLKRYKDALALLEVEAECDVLHVHVHAAALKYGQANKRAPGTKMLISDPVMRSNGHRAFEFTGYPFAEINTRSRARDVEMMSCWAVIQSHYQNKTWPLLKNMFVVRSMARDIKEAIALQAKDQGSNIEFIYWMREMETTVLEYSGERWSGKEARVVILGKNNRPITKTFTHVDHQKEIDSVVKLVLGLQCAHHLPACAWDEKYPRMTLVKIVRDRLQSLVAVCVSLPSRVRPVVNRLIGSSANRLCTEALHERWNRRHHARGHLVC